METPGAGKTCFSRFRGWTTEQREGVSYDVPMTAEPPCCIQRLSGHIQQFSGIVASEQRNTSLPQNLLLGRDAGTTKIFGIADLSIFKAYLACADVVVSENCSVPTM